MRPVLATVPEVVPLDPAVCGRGRGRSATATCPVRPTRRGRLAMTVSGIALTTVLGATALPAVATGLLAAFTGPPAAATTTVTVQPGQSLWQIAAATDPDDDTAQVVARIADANGLTSAAQVRSGQRLVVPLE